MNKKIIFASILVGFLLIDTTFGSKTDFIKHFSTKQLGEQYPLAISPDQGRAAVLAGDLLLNVKLLVDGKPGETYDGISQMVVFSPDSQNIAYYAKQKNKWLFVVGDNEVKFFDRVKGPPIFSNDGKRCATLIEEDGEWMAVLNGEENFRSYSDIKSFRFSMDSSKIGYLAQRADQKWVAIINRTESIPYDNIKWLTFSPDSQHYAFGALKENKELVVIDGKEEKQYNRVSNTNYGFSPDSQSFVYFGYNGQKWVLIQDGKETTEYENVVPNSFIYNKKLLFIATTGNKSSLIIDGQPEKPYDKIELIGFNTNSNRIIYKAKENGKEFFVENGFEGKKYDLISNPVLSDDGEHFAYKAQIGSKFAMIIDGNEQPAYDDVANLVFSKDGKKTAYIGTSDGKQFAVKNGQAENSYVKISDDSLTFSPDGKYLIYCAITNRDTLIINNKKSGYFGKIVSNIVFDDLTKLHFIGVIDYDVYNSYTHITLHFKKCNRYDVELE